MNRTKLILIICMMGNVAAHSEALLEPPMKALSESHSFIRTQPTTSNAVMFVHDAATAPMVSREWNANQSGLTQGTEIAANLITAPTLTQTPTNYGPNGSSDMWLVVLASIGLVAWQLWRKQKSLRFDQSCLAKDADYAVR